MVKTAQGVSSALTGIGAPGEFIAASAERNDPRALSAAMAGSAGDFPDAAQIAVPSLWYLGDADRPFSAGEHRLAAQKETELRVIAGANHATTFTRSADVLSAVLPFLDRR
jgi:pimeloyl-ACP methyl ester carboxylesterase